MDSQFAPRASRKHRQRIARAKETIRSRCEYVENPEDILETPRVMSKMADATEVWTEVLEQLRKQAGSSTLEAYLTDVSVVGQEGDALVIEVPNPFVREKLEREFAGRVREVLRTSRHGNIERLSCVVREAVRQKGSIEEPSAPSTPAAAPEPQKSAGTLNPEYTMARLIVGKSNAYPHALAQSVALNPGKTYNPLYFYGGVGLGKTHLMQAIGHELLKQHSRARVLYCSSEVFHNEYIEHIQHKKPWDAFRKKYRDVDCLLLDDVQFLEAGERIQEEFFHTFNALYQSRKQIVLTSDKKPQELQKMEERLRSRFASGVVVDLQPPDRELREAIVKFWANEEALSVPDDVLRYIAEKVPNNIRDLRGVFRTAVVKSSVLGLPLSIPLADEVLTAAASPAKPHEITIEMIQQEVCSLYGIRLEDLTGRRRDRRTVLPRQIAMYLARDLTGKPLMEIGQSFGKKDHTTVIHSCEKVREEMETNREIQDNVERLRIRIREKLG